MNWDIDWLQTLFGQMRTIQNRNFFLEDGRIFSIFASLWCTGESCLICWQTVVCVVCAGLGEEVQSVDCSCSSRAGQVSAVGEQLSRAVLLWLQSPPSVPLCQTAFFFTSLLLLSSLASQLPCTGDRVGHERRWEERNDFYHQEIYAFVPTVWADCRYKCKIF